MTEITRKCLQLHRKDRIRLIHILSSSLNEAILTDERFHAVLDVATKMMGKGIISTCREYKLVLARRMIAYQLHKEKYSWSSIGRMMLKSHSAIIHMSNMMEDSIKFQLHPEYDIWLEFEKRLKEHDIQQSTDGEA